MVLDPETKAGSSESDWLSYNDPNWLRTLREGVAVSGQKMVPLQGFQITARHMHRLKFTVSLLFSFLMAFEILPFPVQERQKRWMRRSPVGAVQQRSAGPIPAAVDDLGKRAFFLSHPSPLRVHLGIWGPSSTADRSHPPLVRACETLLSFAAAVFLLSPLSSSLSLPSESSSIYHYCDLPQP